MVQQGMLAKLLAKENLRIHHGNYTTAFFDPAARVLGLPIWNVSKDVYDLLVGHEVGHALYTPASAIQDFRKQCPNIPFDALNVVEDIRIERMVQDMYPGLKSAFQKAYVAMVERNFFGTKGKDIATLGFLDRLNLHAKAGTVVNVNLSVEEKAIYDKCLAAQTIEDCIQICKDIAHMIEKSKNDERTNKGEDAKGEDAKGEDAKGEDAKGEDAKGEDDDGTESESGESAGEGEDDKAEESENEEISLNEDSNSPAGESAASTYSEDVGSNSTEGSNACGESIPSSKRSYSSVEEELTSNTADNLQDSLARCLQDTSGTSHAIEPSEQAIRASIIPFKTVLNLRQAKLQYNSFMNAPETKTFIAERRKSANKFVSALTREFEMRKAAFQYSRARQSNSGTLNMSKLHAYRYAEDIFKSNTITPNAKNHGMMMFVDMSSSMQACIDDVFEHTINLVIFCQRLNIPFEVYGFTTPNISRLRSIPAAQWEINIQTLNTVELFSSRMNSKELELAIDQVLANRHFKLIRWSAASIAKYKNVSPVICQYDELHGTPLNETVIVAHTLVRDFRKRNVVQKMNIVFLTDGAGSPLEYECSKLGYRMKTKVSVVINKRLVEYQTHSYSASALDVANIYEKLVENLRITTNSNVIGFFIPMNNGRGITAIDCMFHFDRKLQVSEQNVLDKAKEQYRKEHICVVNGAHNFTSYFVLPPSGELELQEDGDFADAVEANSKLTTSKLARAFTSFNKKKSESRVILKKFSEIIA